MYDLRLFHVKHSCYKVQTSSKYITCFVMAFCLYGFRLNNSIIPRSVKVAVRR